MSDHLGQKALECIKCGCVLSALGMLFFPVGDNFKVLKVMFEVNQKTEGSGVLFFFGFRGFIPFILWLVLIPHAHWLDSSINWR